MSNLDFPHDESWDWTLPPQHRIQNLPAVQPRSRMFQRPRPSIFGTSRVPKHASFVVSDAPDRGFALSDTTKFASFREVIDQIQKANA